MNDKITLIGGSGFIGTRLLDILDRSRCYNIDKNESSKYNEITKIADIRKKDDLLNALNSDTETVILLAAEHSDNAPSSLYYDVNVRGIQNVLECMDKKGIKKIIFTSSAAVYGLNKNNPDENHPADPFRHYGNSKWQAEEVLRKWYRETPVDKSLIIVRPTVIFGEENRGNVYKLLNQIVNGRFLMVGSGNNKKSMAYVGNAAAFLKWSLDNQVSDYKLYNYIDKPDLTMNELIAQVEHCLNISIPSTKFPYWLGMLCGYSFDLLAKLTGKKFSISSVRIEKFCANSQIDSSKMLSSGFIPPYSIIEGLNQTLKKEF